jgi:DNA-binding GntR family transcriptional regulator
MPKTPDEKRSAPRSPSRLTRAVSTGRGGGGAAFSERAYAFLHKKFDDRQFAIGQKISEEKLAQELGVSRSPMREAIKRLQSEGLLVQVASSGTFVAQPTRRQLIEMYEVREAIEVMAVRKAVKRIRAPAMAQFTSAYEQMRSLTHAFRDSGKPRMEGRTLRDFLAADLAFHAVIARAAENATANRILSDVRLRHRVFGLLSHGRDVQHLSRVLLGHGRVLAAVRRRDAKLAARQLRNHIRFSLREALRAFDAHAETMMLRPLSTEHRSA